MRSICLLAILLYTCGLSAQSTDVVTTEMPVLRIDASDTTRPWTHLNLNNSPRNFQFAIVTDRTGGVRPGIFEEAVTKLNLLQPEFVMSVGDLIMGYTQDHEELTRQWNEFNSFVHQLTMPFFYVPGNHDLANATEHKFWERLIGRKYYHFVYGDVLFLCVNSDDPVSCVSAEQTAYFDKVLKENKDVRWTLVFLHRPLWVGKAEAYDAEEETYDATGWSEFERVLKGRPYTVFAGHFHKYTKQVRHNQRYITLATTGGGSAMRGALNYGEFDHVAWVTMTDDGPIVANIALYGIFDENLRTEEVARLVNGVLQKTIQTRPLPVPSAPFARTKTQVRLTNDADIPLKIWLTVDPHSDVTVSPATIEKTLQPNSVELVDLAVNGSKVTDPLALQYNPLMLRWRTLYEPEGQRKIELTGDRQIEVIPPLFVTQRTRPVTIDGNVDEWSTMPIYFRRPRQMDGKQPWNNWQDASANFSVQHDDKYLYFAAKVTDEALVTSGSVSEGLPDSIEVRVRAVEENKTRSGEWKKPLSARQIRQQAAKAAKAAKRRATTTGTLMYSIAPGEPAQGYDGASAACSISKTGYNVEFAIPLSKLEAIGADADHFQFNFVITDRDRKDLPASARLWWQPDWSGPQKLEGAGVFIGR